MSRLNATDYYLLLDNKNQKSLKIYKELTDSSIFDIKLSNDDYFSEILNNDTTKLKVTIYKNKNYFVIVVIDLITNEYKTIDLLKINNDDLIKFNKINNSTFICYED